MVATASFSWFHASKLYLVHLGNCYFPFIFIFLKKKSFKKLIKRGTKLTSVCCISRDDIFRKKKKKKKKGGKRLVQLVSKLFNSRGGGSQPMDKFDKVTPFYYKKKVIEYKQTICILFFSFS